MVGDLIDMYFVQKSEVLRHQRSLSRRQSAETLRELTPEDLRRELKDQQRKQVESDKTIAALKLACAVSVYNIIFWSGKK